MDKALIPEWIKDINEKTEERKRSSREIAIAESLVRVEAPGVWDEFIRELRIQCEGCKTLCEVGKVTLDDVSQSNPPDKAFKLSIFGSGPFGSLLSIIVRLKLEHCHPHIECLREDREKDFKILFRVDLLNKVCLVTNCESTPRMAAECVVKSMIRDLGIDFSE